MSANQPQTVLRKEIDNALIHSTMGISQIDLDNLDRFKNVIINREQVVDAMIAALSAMVAAVLGDDIICDGTCDDSAHAGQKQLLYEQRQRAISKGFDMKGGE